MISQHEGRQSSYMLLRRFHREAVRMFPSICGIDFLLKVEIHVQLHCRGLLKAQ